MTPNHLSNRRALTLLELMLSLVVTALIAGAVAGMMAAVTTGVSTRRDTRSTMVGANAASARLGGYIATARCILYANGSNLVIWLNDDRESETVHATEVRWFLFNPASDSFQVHFVSFPDAWAQAAKDLEDGEYPPDANWMQVLASFKSKGWTTSMPLVDNLDAVAITTNHADPLTSRHIGFDLSFLTSDSTMDVCVAATIRMHRIPSS